MGFNSGFKGLNLSGNQLLYGTLSKFRVVVFPSSLLKVCA